RCSGALPRARASRSATLSLGLLMAAAPWGIRCGCNRFTPPSRLSDEDPVSKRFPIVRGTRMFQSTPLRAAAVLLTAALLAGAARAQDRPQKQEKPHVEVVFCLDTTSSMTGLIDAAKQKIWAISNQ